MADLVPPLPAFLTAPAMSIPPAGAAAPQLPVFAQQQAGNAPTSGMPAPPQQTSAAPAPTGLDAASAGVPLALNNAAGFDSPQMPGGDPGAVVSAIGRGLGAVGRGIGSVFTGDPTAAAVAGAPAAPVGPAGPIDPGVLAPAHDPNVAPGTAAAYKSAGVDGVSTLHTGEQHPTTHSFEDIVNANSHLTTKDAQLMLSAMRPNLNPHDQVVTELHNSISAQRTREEAAAQEAYNKYAGDDVLAKLGTDANAKQQAIAKGVAERNKGLTLAATKYQNALKVLVGTSNPYSMRDAYAPGGVQ